MSDIIYIEVISFSVHDISPFVFNSFDLFTSALDIVLFVPCHIQDNDYQSLNFERAMEREKKTEK